MQTRWRVVHPVFSLEMTQLLGVTTKLDPAVAKNGTTGWGLDTQGGRGSKAGKKKTNPVTFAAPSALESIGRMSKPFCPYVPEGKSDWVRVTLGVAVPIGSSCISDRF